ncbi:DUF1275 domain-containing protein [Listeria booriae]|nr:DUF1275 domain-containing protein [Listeria booriae]
MYMPSHEHPSVGLSLTFISGMINTATYINYQAFATAQTGNLILALSQLYHRQWDSAGKKILSLLFFFLGILLAMWIRDYFLKKNPSFHWRLYLLYGQVFLFLAFCLPTLQRHPALIVILISFVSAIQWESFDKINGLPYTNLFTTGNLKGMASSLYDFRKTKETAAKIRFFHFSRVIIAFILGCLMTLFWLSFVHVNIFVAIAGAFFLLALFRSYWILRKNDWSHF